jgi:DNA-binding ferritin-like protein (Dps family)
MDMQVGVSGVDGVSGTGGEVLTKPKHVVSLATSCVLVSIESHVWNATVQDKQISDEVTTAKKASSDSGKFVKNLLAKNVEHKAVLNYRQTIYNWMQRCTYDWAGSQRLLPIANLATFHKEYREHEQKFAELVDDFLDKYPSIVSNMAFVQGDMFDRSEYPDVSELRQKFSIDLVQSEVPTGDFRCQISQDLLDDMTTHYERQAKRMVESVLAKQSAQLVDILKSISYCCEVETTIDNNGEVKVRRRKLYDSTLDRARELCETFRTFNLMADPKLEEARASLETLLSGVEIEKLRNSDTQRVVIKEGIDDILAKFGV